MKSILAFLNKIKENNSKEWLDAHRAEYQAATQAFNLLVEQLIAGISEFDSSIKGITVKDCTYRFNRDITFTLSQQAPVISMEACCARGFIVLNPPY